MISIKEHRIWTSTPGSYLNFKFYGNINVIKITCEGLRGPYSVWVGRINGYDIEKFNVKYAAIDYFQKVIANVECLASVNYYSTESDPAYTAIPFPETSRSPSPEYVPASPEQIAAVMSHVDKSFFQEETTSEIRNNRKRGSRKFKLSLSGIRSPRSNVSSPRSPHTPRRKNALSSSSRLSKNLTPRGSPRNTSLKKTRKSKSADSSPRDNIANCDNYVRQSVSSYDIEKLCSSLNQI